MPRSIAGATLLLARLSRAARARGSSPAGRSARFPGVDAEILAAVAAEEAAMIALLSDLVEAPTLLGAEAPGQDIMRRAFAELGLEVGDVPLDGAALESHQGASPFSWDVAGKTFLKKKDQVTQTHIQFDLAEQAVVEWPIHPQATLETFFRGMPAGEIASYVRVIDLDAT